MLIPILIRYMSKRIAGLEYHEELMQPLVSIGMPVYNRPDGLSRALTCLTGQTYRNIEIIVSDNCSPDADVKRVVESFMQHDKRITYFRQESSLGIAGNFKFVLEQATGDYFMWAADDDEWNKDFIKVCLADLMEDGVVSVMSNFSTLYRHNGESVKGVMPEILPTLGMAGNALAFLDCMTPSLFYGLHKRQNITFFLEECFFDFFDCYFMLRLILQGEVRIVKPALYVAGVDAPDYQVKPAKKYRFTKLKYSSFFYYSVQSVAASSLRISEKVKVLIKLLRVVISMFLFHEVKRVFK